MTNREEHVLQEREESKKLIERPLRWPRYPLLPMKKRNPERGWPEFGVMVVGNDKTVYAIGLNVIPSTPNIQSWLEENCNRRILYDSLDSLIEAGWVVD